MKAPRFASAFYFTSLVVITSALASVLLPSQALAESPKDNPYPKSSEAQPRLPEILVSTGVRAMAIPSHGFDAFAENDVLLQSSFSAGLTFFRSGSVSTSASFEWDAGGKSSSTRGLDVSLFVHRLSIPLEARWQPVKRVALFVRVAPGANRLLGSADPTLRARNWSFGVDATGGTAFMLGKAKSARFWITAEVGYSFAFAASMKLVHVQNEDEAPRKQGGTVLPDLSVGGGLGRLGVAVSF